MNKPLPLKGVRVVEFGVAIAGPFAASLLSDLGAEVIKVERPGEGDTTREFGHRANGVTVWWGVSARNKKCITLDLKAPADQAYFRDLLSSADVFIENFRPGVVARLGFGWPELSKLNPRLIMLSVSGFGQTGPESGRPGFGKIAEAMSGMVALTGRPDEHPLHVGFSLADAATGLMGFYAVSLALYLRDVEGGRGSYIDLALYESLFRMNECQLGLLEKLGRCPMRTGSNDPYGWGASGRDDRQIRCFATGDDAWVAVLLDPKNLDRPSGVLACDASLDAVSAALGAVIEGLSLEAARVFLSGNGFEAARVHDGQSIAGTDYFRKRGDVLSAQDDVIGELDVSSILPRMYDRRGIEAFRRPGLGEDNGSYRPAGT